MPPSARVRQAPPYSSGSKLKAKGTTLNHLMSQVMGQRVEMATQLLQEVAHDLESGDLEFDTPGLAELSKVVQTLAERMSRLFPQ